MRYFICPSENLPRLCTVEPIDSRYRILWLVFDFMEDNNLRTERSKELDDASGFIDNVLLRLQKFREVTKEEYERELAGVSERALSLEPSRPRKFHRIQE